MTDTTPSQTVGPFFNIGLPGDQADLVDPGSDAAIRLWGLVTDGEGEPVPDAMVEIWQAGPDGRHDHPEDAPGSGFRGFGRAETGDDGRYEFVTVKPGRVPAPAGGLQAPHVSVSVFARGLLKRLATRAYFADEDTEGDPVLAGVEEDRRHTLAATADGEGGYRFDIRLQGDEETVFFDV
jgi:protocatechuate 3,4-dioxygenase alpha subunit